MKNWVFFDVMGVVFTVGDDTNELLVPFIQKRNKTISAENINELYIKASLGRISSKEFWVQVKLHKDYPEIEVEYLNNCLTLDENIIDVFKKLSPKYNIGLISNDVSEWSKYLRKKYDLDRYISCCIVSGDVGYRKPDIRIYEPAREIFDTGNAVFIDDRTKNLYPAIEVGMSVIKFNREEQYNHKLKMPQIDTLLDLPELVERIFEHNI